MNSNLNEEPSSDSNGVDMSSSAIASRIRETSELNQLGLSLGKAKPMAMEPSSCGENAYEVKLVLSSTSDSTKGSQPSN
jgi:hypothetical protein